MYIRSCAEARAAQQPACLQAVASYPLASHRLCSSYSALLRFLKLYLSGVLSRAFAVLLPGTFLLRWLQGLSPLKVTLSEGPL